MDALKQRDTFNSDYSRDVRINPLICSPADFMNVYFQIRSNQLDRSIKGLKDHFRKNSASSGVLYSPAVQTKRKDTPTKKAPKRPGQQRTRSIIAPLPSVITAQHTSRLTKEPHLSITWLMKQQQHLSVR